jgi:hypothetical protein
VRGLFSFLGTLVAGSAGWWLGDLWCLEAAVVLSAVGSGVGLYWGRRLFDDWLGG